jgi:hypothetical protein
LYADGTKYVGQFEDGFRVFHGVVTFPRGDSYTGEVRDGRPYGDGIYLGTDGEATMQVTSPAASISPAPAGGVVAPATSPDPAGQPALSTTPPASSAVAARPVVEEIRKLREEWLRLAEKKVQQEQVLMGS